MFFVLLTVLSVLLQLFLPWWIIAPLAFGLALWQAHSGWQAFGVGFGAIALVWLGAGLLSHLQTGGLLSARVADLFGLPSPWLLLLVTVLIGGLVGGLSALSGFQFQQIILSPDRGGFPRG